MKRFSKILFVAEAESGDAWALGRAIERARNNQAQLTVVAVVDDVTGRGGPTRLQTAIVEEEEERIRALLSAVPTTDVRIDVKVFRGDPSLEIIREVLRFERDLVIKAAERDSSHGLASVDKKLLRKCPCPVWLVLGGHDQDYKQILVALDHDPENPEIDALNRQLLEMASSLALSEFAELHVVHAWEMLHEEVLRSPRLGLSKEEVDAMAADEEARRREWLGEIVERCCGSGDARDFISPEIHILKGRAKYVVPELASDLDADLVVMGTVGRTGIPGYIIGNTAETILGQLRCSILAVKPADFVSPVSLE